MAALHRFTVAWLALLCALAGPGEARAQGAEAGRARARAAMIAGCLREGQADPEARGLELRAVCDCFADYVVDRATVADLDDPDSPHATALIGQAAKACADAPRGGR